MIAVPLMYRSHNITLRDIAFKDKTKQMVLVGGGLNIHDINIFPVRFSFVLPPFNTTMHCIKNSDAISSI